MIYELLPSLRGKTIVLSSSSPRRQTILRDAGLSFHINPSNFEENLDKGLYSPVNYALATSRGKIMEVNQRIGDADLIISCDTVIAHGDEIFEKPLNNSKAKEMLLRHSGSWHDVHSGVCLVVDKDLLKDTVRQSCFEVRPPNDGSVPHGDRGYTIDMLGDTRCIVQFSCTTEVLFSDMSATEVDIYVATGESADKAGGYGIQALGGVFVQEIRGNYQNVIGFPLQKFFGVLKKILA